MIRAFWGLRILIRANPRSGELIPDIRTFMTGVGMIHYSVSLPFSSG